MTTETTSSSPEPSQGQGAPEPAGETNGKWLQGWRRFAAALQGTGLFSPAEWPIRTLIGTIIAIAVILLALALLRQGFAHVHENEVGVLADNLNTEHPLLLKERVGYHFFLPYLFNFYVLDKTIQKLNLTWDQGPGAQSGREVKLKTADGNNVSLDISVNYKLIPGKAVKVLQGSGLGMRFAETWVEPYARQCSFAAFGRLKTEDLYDATKRNEMAQATLKDMNDKLMPHGIEIIAVIPGEFHFYHEYEQVISEKKLSDQEVEQQQAEARHALEDQERQLIEARKKAEARLATLDGEMTNRFIQALAEVEKIKREAEGQSKFAMVAADSALYSTTKQAEGRKATLLADAEGVAQMRKAMAGDGGVGMVGLEYAKRMNTIRFTGTAVTKQPTIQQLSVQPAEAAAATSGSAPR